MKTNTFIKTVREPVNCSLRLRTFTTILMTLASLWLPGTAFGLGYWTALTTQPGDSIGICLLLPDGTVLAEGSGANWYKLAPDGNGHYVNGQWSQRQSSTWGHQDGSTVVLMNGTVFVGGGENGNGGYQVEIFDPATGLWNTAVNPSPIGNIADGNAMLLSDGRVMIYPPSDTTYLFNPGNRTFSRTIGAPLNGLSESSWVKLPNDNILVIDSDNGSTGATTAEMYNPSTGTWQNAVTGGAVPNIWPDLTGSGIVSEMGPAFLLPNGNAIFFGGNLVTAIYNTGTWSQGASLNNGLGMKDAPGAMMVNGNILLAVSPQGDNSSRDNGNGIGPTSFYEFDYRANGGIGVFTPAPSPGSGIASRAGILKMLDLPDGTVLLSTGGGQLYVYQPDGPSLAAGKPSISSHSWTSPGSLHLTGTLFNGISQGAGYGDDGQMDSNYPLVRFTDGSGHVYYGRTYNWSSTSVMSSRPVTTEVALPPGLPMPGSYTLQVVANGFASDPISFAGSVWAAFGIPDPGDGSYARPYNTMVRARDGVSPSGAIFIKGPTSTSETITISKKMSILAVGGPATIGRN
jgi:hypothetical protein